MKKIASASGNFHEIMRARNAGNTHLIKTISCFLICYYNKIFKVISSLNGQRIAQKKGRYQDFETASEPHNTQQTDTSSQKQKDTLNTFKSFLQEQRDKQTNIYLKRRCLKTTNNGKYFFSFFIMNVVTKKVTHLHIW